MGWGGGWGVGGWGGGVEEWLRRVKVSVTVGGRVGVMVRVWD